MKEKRKEKMEKKNISVNLPANVIEAMQEVAKKKGVSFSELSRRIYEFYLEKRKKEGKKP